MALWVWLLGGDLAAAKLFLNIVSASLSMAMLIATLRLFRLAPWGRFFVALASGWWVFDTYFQIGATRTFLGLWLVGLWLAGLRKTQGGWPRALLFPSILPVFLYSPEIGFDLLPVGLAVAGFDCLQLSAPRRKAALLAYGGGALLAFGLFAAGYLRFDWFRNYVRFFLYRSSNMVWAYGPPLPGARQFFSSPGEWFHFHPWPPMTLWPPPKPSLGNWLYVLPYLVVAGATGRILVTAVRGKISQIPIWIPACVLYGAMLLSSTFLTMDGPHLLFGLPPIMILLGQLFSRKSRYGAVKLVLLGLFLWGWTFFLYAPPSIPCGQYLIQKRRIQKQWDKFSGVFETPEQKQMYDSLDAFIKAHPGDLFLFPLHSFDAYRLGQPLRLPVDDPTWLNLRERREQLLDLMRDLDAAYICLNMFFLNFDLYVNEDYEEMFDFIATHYQPVKVIGTTIIYERLSEPRVLARKILSDPRPIRLSRQEDFRAGWVLPDDWSGGYIEIRADFSYPSRFSQRFSRPLVDVRLNNNQLQLKTTQGSCRIRNTPGGGNYRIYVHGEVKKVSIQILFPGLVNLQPSSVTLKDVSLYQFNYLPRVPYNRALVK
jgi:hypothetical protein